MPTSITAHPSSRRLLGQAFALLFVMSASVAWAAAPVGDEYGVGDRALPPKQWWTSCVDGAGRVASLAVDCSGADCDSPGDVFLQRVDSKGKPVGARVRVNDEPAWRSGFRVACHESGWVLAQWVENGCATFRAFDAQGKAAGSAMVASDLDCRTRPNLAIDADQRVFAVWPSAVPAGGTRIFARSFSASGTPVGDPQLVSPDQSGWRLQPKVAVDDAGNVLVAWIGDARSDEGAPAVMARFLHANSAPASEAMRLDTFGYGENQDPAIRVVAAGVFEVAWTNVLEGGRVAREVSSTAVPTAEAAPAAWRAADSGPVFGAPRFVDSHPSADDLLATLQAGAGSTSVVSRPTGAHLRSDDDSATWQGPVATAAEPVAREFLGSDGEGTWIALRLSADADEIEVARSASDAATWTTLEKTLSAAPAGDLVDARVRGSGSTWIAAWTVRRPGQQAELVLVRSADGGLTWGKPKSLAVGEAVGSRGFALETGGNGTWLAMLADTGVRFARSTDDGASWKGPAPAVEDVACENCAGAWRFTQAGLASDGGGKWVAVFAGFQFEPDTYGRDGDVFALRSDDDAASWSAPIAVAPWAGVDGSPDFQPSIATDGDGTWLASWVTHHPATIGDSLDSDVVTATSRDAGATWSPPSLLSAAMATDAASDQHPSLAATGSGHWLALWERHDLREQEGVPRGDLLVAAATADCGNGAREVGESCDDGNTDDDDGCDSDCTAGRCGNGIRNSGEECDDGNRDDDDACTSACRLPSCGDGIVSSGEECDDGNTEEGDACHNRCGMAGCGDGVVHQGYEACDEGGRSSTTCTPDCQVPRCGDGHVAAWGEACDDGNTVDGDACPNDCSRATCGDGLTSLGWEECDFADPMWTSQCTKACRAIDVCGDANADGKVTTGDARVVLRKAVGLDADCPRAACDMNANGSISASDALTDLRVAVGIPVGERCSIGTGTIVFWVETSAEVASFQVEIDYSSTGGEFSGSGSEVSCEAFREGSDVFVVAFNDDEAHWMLVAGVVALETFTGPLDLFRCEFEMPEQRSGAHFAVRVVEATDPDGVTVKPLPKVGYRVE